MEVVVACSFIALFLTYFESKGQVRNGMFYGFALVTFLGMVHYNYGNDYMSYFDIFKDVTSYHFNFNAIIGRDYYNDPGWVLLCFLFKPFGGFFMLVAVLNLIQNAIVYNFIKKYIEKKWWALGVFTYLFVTDYYLLSFSLMRQMFVIVVFLGMWKYIVERKWWIPLVVFYLCSYVHGSALILLPFAFWGFVPMNDSRYLGFGYAILLLGLWLLGDMLNDIFLFALTMDDSFMQYSETYGNVDKGLKMGLGFVINMIPFVLSIKFLLSKKDYSWQQKSLVAMGAISFLVAPFSQIIRLVSRVGYYFGIYTIASLPLIYKDIENVYLRRALIVCYVIMTMYSYYNFFNEGVYSLPYSEFHTIFECM